MTQWAFPSTYVARTHTVLSSSAFVVALIIGLLYHYKKIVKNAVAQYPDEWWPSVSATIGDWYPERNLFQFLIALTSGMYLNGTHKELFTSVVRTPPWPSLCPVPSALEF